MQADKGMTSLAKFHILLTLPSWLNPLGFVIPSGLVWQCFTALVYPPTTVCKGNVDMQKLPCVSYDVNYNEV